MDAFETKGRLICRLILRHASFSDEDRNAMRRICREFLGWIVIKVPHLPRKLLKAIPSERAQFLGRRMTMHWTESKKPCCLHRASPIWKFVTPQTRLCFRDNWRWPVGAHQLPVTLTHLVFGKRFNQSVDDLPAALLHLELGYEFDQPVEKLPAGLTHLVFGFKFNQSVDSLPPGLLHLTFCSQGRFNQLINHLPSALISLTLGWTFRREVKQLPDSLRILILAHRANEICETLLLPAVYSSPFHQSDLTFLPANLIHLTPGLLPRSVDGLPMGLTHLYLDSARWFDQPVDSLPATLVYLSLGKAFNQPVDRLPSGLLVLLFKGEWFNQPLDHLPSRLRRLEFVVDSHFNQPVDHLPGELVRLRLGSSFNQSINHLPPGLRFLEIGSRFDQPILRLPPALHSLKLGNSFSHPLMLLPTNLNELVLGSSYCHDTHLPVHLAFLSIWPRPHELIREEDGSAKLVFH